MYEKLKILADIQLFEGENMRQVPFVTGYRPLFNFIGASTKISGRIDLINRESFAPGVHDIVQITFLKDMIDNKHFKLNQSFTFSEGGEYNLGEGKIIEIIDP